MTTELSPYCAQYRRAMEIIGRRWTGAILRAMFTGTTRFAEIRRVVPGLSDRLLSERLKELESEGLISRCVTPDTPVLIEYRLTDKGRALEDVIRAVSDWATEWIEGPAANTA